MPMAISPPANIDTGAALAEAEELYRANNPKSLAQHRQACEAMPGGNTRSAIHVDPFPVTMVRGEGARLWDLDGHEYVDFLSEFTAGIYGHSHPAILRAVAEALAGGLNFGAHNATEARFAAAICARFPSIDLVRFTNSGTEANLMAVSAAVAITGRPKVLVFEGGYHGGVFYFRGHGSRLNAPFDYLLGRYNDLAAVEALVAPHRAELAAILVEPMQGTTGCIPAERQFLAGLCNLADETGALLIFDEVMTSRLAPGGLQEVHGILPDLTTLGKYIGGGMSFGAFGGRADVMERFDPRRPDAFQHAGTFNNNELNAVARRHGLAMQFTGLGSMLSVHMTDGPIRSQEDAERGNAALRDLFYFDLLARGIWFAKRGMFALSLALDEADGGKLVEAVEEFAQTRAPLFEGLAR
jgi:glutamate-1-semialdehyde 2,1-aminomutase